MQITGGKYNSRKIKTPDFENIKPTLSKTRQGIFNTLNTLYEFKSFEGKIFIDLFSGSGIMGLEAISRGFTAILFEKDKRTAIAIKEVFKNFDLVPELYFGDSLKNITKIKKAADVIFIDPPYNSDLYEKSLDIILKNKILSPNGIIIIEHPIDKIINFSNFKLIKTKLYGNKQITYLNLI